MRMSLFALTLSTLALGATAPAFAEPATGKTKDFIEKAAIAGMFEIETSKLAVTMSDNAEIKKFAQQMIDDHTKASEDLKVVVSASGLDSTVMPVSMDKDHDKDLAELKAKTGKDFNEDYVDEQVEAHEDAVALFKDYANDGDNAALKAFAAKTLPTLEAHKTHIDALDKKID